MQALIGLKKQQCVCSIALVSKIICMIPKIDQDLSFCLRACVTYTVDKNKIWHSGHNRHIALLKKTHKQVEIGYSVYIYKATGIHSEIVFSVSPEI